MLRRKFMRISHFHILGYGLLVLLLGGCSAMGWGKAKQEKPDTQEPVIVQSEQLKRETPLDTPRDTSIDTPREIPDTPNEVPQKKPGQVELIDLPLSDFTDSGVVPDNTIVAILQDVEINYETPVQLKQICTALNDMATLSASDIQKRRYADFNGKQGEWTLLQVMYAYFLPTQKVNLQNFYEDIEQPLSREIVRETLKDMQEYCAPKSGTQGEAVSGW